MAYIEINGSFHEDAPIEQKAHLVKALDAIANKISTQDLSCWQTDRSFYRFLEVPESVADSPDKTFCFPEHLAGVVKDISCGTSYLVNLVRPDRAPDAKPWDPGVWTFSQTANREQADEEANSLRQFMDLGIPLDELDV